MNTLYYVGREEFKRVLSLKISPLEKTKIFSTFARINTLYMIAKAGSGHIGSSFSSMDIFSWLHVNVLKKNDIFFSSKGHDAPGLYSVLIGLGNIDFDYIHKLRRLNGLPGHPDVGTPGITTNTGSLGMGVSKAKGMVHSNRLDGIKCQVYVLTGDGELQEGQFWESLSGAVNNQFEEITVIVDHNKIQSDTWVDNVSSLGNLEEKFKSFGWHVERCNGNSLEEISSALEATSKVKKKPQVIIADTIKGAGVSFMESKVLAKTDEFYKFHSGAPSPHDYERAANELINHANALLNDIQESQLKIQTSKREELKNLQNNIQKLIPAYEEALYEVGVRNKDVVVLDADLMIDCGLLSFRNKYPDRFIECGIAEQDMVSQTGALGLKGKLPIAHSFACFLTQRANEQIFNNASEQTKCIYVGSLAGLLPSGPGHSHQMVRDIAALGGIPGLTMIEPSCEAEVQMALNYAVDKNPHSTYIRLVSIPCEIPFELPVEYKLEMGVGVQLTDGDDAIIFSYGPVLLSEAYKAAQILMEKHQFSLKVVNLPWLNEIDTDWLEKIIGTTKAVYTLDNHLLDGGQGEKIGARIAECSLSKDITLKRLGLSKIPVCGRNDEVLAYYGLDADSLINTILR